MLAMENRHSSLQAHVGYGQKKTDMQAYFDAIVYVSELTCVRKVFVDSKANYDTVTVNLSSRIEPKVFKLINPDRLVVDFQGAFWKGASQSVFVKSDRISTVRLAQNSRNPDNVRLVIDLLKSADNKIFISDDGKTAQIKIGNLSDVKDAISKSGDADEPKNTQEYEEVTPKIGLSSIKLKKGAVIYGSSKREASIVISTEEALGSKRQTIEVPDESPKEEDLATEESSVYKNPIGPSSKIKVPPLSRMKSYSVFINGSKMDLGKNRHCKN